MGRLLGFSFIVLSIVLCCLSFGGLILFTTDSEQLHDLIQDRICAADETLVTTRSSTTITDFEIGQESPGTSINYYCEDNTDGKRRQVTGTVITAGIIAFVVPFVIGLILFMTGVAMLIRGFMRRSVQQVVPQMVYGQGAGMSMSPNQVVFTQNTYTAAEVEAKLAQLRQMVNMGAMTQDQYDQIEAQLRARQQ